MQAYDFEASFSCYNGSFALAGFLPVVPGPCGLYRKADICGAPAEWYFDIVNQSPAETGHAHRQSTRRPPDHPLALSG